MSTPGERHSGDCLIYSMMTNGSVSDAYCTCGYYSELLSEERQFHETKEKEPTSDG